VSVETREMILNPSEQQYWQLVEDFKVLRAAGAESNTAALVAAVRAEADRVRATPQLRKVA
jgi:hypothetical protein